MAKIHQVKNTCYIIYNNISIKSKNMKIIVDRISGVYRVESKYYSVLFTEESLPMIFFKNH